MTIRLFNDVQQWPDDDGVSLAGGKLYFYEAGTTTLKDTYTSKSLGTAQANPVILDADGRPTNPIWLDGEYKYKVTNSVGVTIGLVIDNLNAETASDIVETGVVPPNGSFEVDSNADGTPDGWTLTRLTDATIAIDTTDSAHGKNSLKFLSGGNGGGLATGELFDVLKDEVVTVEFTYKASSATVKTFVHVYTYDKDDGLVSQLEAYTEASSNPTSYDTKSGAVTIDATAVRAKIVITGIEATGTKTAGTTTHFDYIKVNRKLISDVIGDVVGNVTGDITGNAATVTTNANLTGDVTSVGNATTISSDTVTSAMHVAPATGSTVIKRCLGATTPATTTQTSYDAADTYHYIPNTTFVIGTVLVAGVIKVSLEHAAGETNHDSYVRVLKNGSEEDSWSTAATGYSARTVDITVAVGDLITVQHHIDVTTAGKLRDLLVESDSANIAIA
jgi:hypothetical protein